MTDSVPPNTASSFSSKLTRRLVKQAESLMDQGDLDNQQIDERFTALGEDAITALGAGQEQQRDLAQLASLISQSGGKEIGLNGTFELSDSEDRMFLSVSITPALGRADPVTTKDIVDELRSRGIQQGVMIAAIKKAVDDAEHGKEACDRVIVRGMPPQEATDPWLVFFGRKRGGEIVELNEQALQSPSDPALCLVGDTIAYIRQGDEGLAGYTATGEVLPAPPAKSEGLKAGPNVDVSGCHYNAQASGVVILKDNCIEVQKALIFNQDVSRSDSPIKFDGSIYIHGGVHSGVHIEATDDIFIDRVVEGATLISQHGDVVLRAGIAGRNQGVVRAGNDFISGFAENASVVAGRDIKLQVGSLNSQLTATRDILAETGKGGISGGVLIAGSSIHAKRIGSCGTSTVIINGVGPEELPLLSEISSAAANHQLRLDEVIELITQFKRAVKDLNKLSAQELTTYTYLQKLRVVTDHELDALEARRNETLQKSVACAHGDVKVFQKLGPGVIFHVGSMKYIQRETKGPLTITYDPRHNRIVCHKR